MKNKNRVIFLMFVILMKSNFSFDLKSMMMSIIKNGLIGVGASVIVLTLLEKINGNFDSGNSNSLVVLEKELKELSSFQKDILSNCLSFLSHNGKQPKIEDYLKIFPSEVNFQGLHYSLSSLDQGEFFELDEKNKMNISIEDDQYGYEDYKRQRRKEFEIKKKEPLDTLELNNASSNLNNISFDSQKNLVTNQINTIEEAFDGKFFKKYLFFGITGSGK